MDTSPQPKQLITRPQQVPQHAWLFFVAFASAVTALVVWMEAPVPVRAVVVFSFLLLVPGWSFIRLLGITNTTAGWTLAIALSLALDTLVAMLLLYTDNWSVQTGLLLVIVISLAGALIRLREKAVVEGPIQEIPAPAEPQPRMGKRNGGGER